MRQNVLIRAGLYTRLLGLPYKIIYREREDPLGSVGAAHLPYPYAWMLFRAQDSQFIAEQGDALGRVFCDRLPEAWGYTLETPCPVSGALPGQSRSSGFRLRH